MKGKIEIEGLTVLWIVIIIGVALFFVVSALDYVTSEQDCVEKQDCRQYCFDLCEDLDSTSFKYRCEWNPFGSICKCECFEEAEEIR